MRCSSSVESRYNHSSSPNRRPETRPSQILNVESFIFQNGASAQHMYTHTHILSLLFGGAPESSLKTQQTLHLLLPLRTQQHGGPIQRNYCLCLWVCVFVNMWALCCVLRLDITAWKNQPYLKVIIPFWEQSLLWGGYWGSRIVERERAECSQVAGSKASDTQAETECFNGTLLLKENKKPLLLNYPIHKMLHIYAR